MKIEDLLNLGSRRVRTAEMVVDVNVDWKSCFEPLKRVQIVVYSFVEGFLTVALRLQFAYFASSLIVPSL